MRAAMMRAPIPRIHPSHIIAGQAKLTHSCLWLSVAHASSMPVLCYTSDWRPDIPWSRRCIARLLRVVLEGKEQLTDGVKCAMPYAPGSGAKVGSNVSNRQSRPRAIVSEFGVFGNDAFRFLCILMMSAGHLFCARFRRAEDARQGLLRK